jgi:hypothetical protein
MKYSGFQEISYHQVWDLGVNRDYKRFLQLKIRELAKKFGLKLVDEADEDEEEERAVSEPDDEETTVDDDSEALGLGAGVSSSVVRKTPSHSVVRVAHEVAEPLSEDIEDTEVVVEEVTRERVAQTLRVLSMSHFVSSPSFQRQEQLSIQVVPTDSMFIERG